MRKSQNTGISFFERYLTVWVILCMFIGIFISKLFPFIPEFLNKFQYANVSIPIAIPLIIQTFIIFFIAYFACRILKLPYCIAAPAGMIGASNFFELAVAVAIALFGTQSPVALATIVGVLVEVPVMLTLVKIANKTKGGLNRWLV